MEEHGIHTLEGNAKAEPKKHHPSQSHLIDKIAANVLFLRLKSLVMHICACFTQESLC